MSALSTDLPGEGWHGMGTAEGSRTGAELALGQMLADAAPLSGAGVPAALAAPQAARPRVVLAFHPPDPSLLPDIDPRPMLRLGYLPWRRLHEVLIVAVAEPAAIPAIRAGLTAEGVGRIVCVQAARAEIEEAILRDRGPALNRITRDRCPDAYSCRRFGTRRAAALLGLSLGALAALAVVAPAVLMSAALVWITLANSGTTLLRAFALFQRGPRRGMRRFGGPRKAPSDPEAVLLPTVSLLIPLLREDVVLPQLLSALDRSTYPKDRLDVILILEDDDVTTPLALARLSLPDWVRVVTAPPDPIRTKPRALNYALEIARGSIVGVYDAEDLPEPDQLLRVARHFAAAGPEVACVQGYLDFYNARQNWLSRCFAIEYAIWFRVLLNGVLRLGIPIPLGGTTVFFRRDALERVGGWDSYNVTEDADLGMRLARFGYRTEMVATTTREEANCLARPWIVQRARWLKGYAITWATHMRRPRELLRDLGPVGFLGFQVLFLGALTAYLAAPIFWALWAAVWGFELRLAEMLPGWLWAISLASMLIGQAVMLAVAIRACLSHDRLHLVPVVPSLMLYWPLGAIAAYRAVGQLVTRPFYWAKTRHGL